MESSTPFINPDEGEPVLDHNIPGVIVRSSPYVIIDPVIREPVLNSETAIQARKNDRIQMWMQTATIAAMGAFLTNRLNHDEESC